jgi:hypothetical protein
MEGLLNHLVFSIVLLVAIVVIALVKVDPWWLRLSLIDLLAVMLARRVNALGVQVGGELMPSGLNDVLTVISVIAILGSFMAVWLRRKEFHQVERLRQTREKIARLERLRASSEVYLPWDYQDRYPKV